MQILQIVSEKRKMGKTLIGERIVRELVKKGHKVCVIKHTHHNVDLLDKDSGRYRSKGASTVVVYGKEFVVIKDSPPPIIDVFTQLSLECNVVVVEGFLKEGSGEVKANCIIEVRRDGFVLSLHDKKHVFSRNETEALIGKTLGLIEKHYCQL